MKFNYSKCVAMCLLIASSLLAITTSSAVSVATQDTKDSTSSPFRVKVNVTVFDPSNRPVNDVTKEDFQVSENDVQQTVTSVAQQSGPLSYGLVIDCSGSLRSQLTEVIKSAQAFVASMKPEDEAFVMRFVSWEKIKVVQDWTSNKTKLMRALDEMYPEGGQSAILDAVYTAAQRVEERKKQELTPHRPGLLLITDGTDRINQIGLAQLMKLTGESDLQIYVIGLVEAIDDKDEKEKAVNFLHTLANMTGGRVFLLDDKLEPFESGPGTEPAGRAVMSRRALQLHQIIAAIGMEHEAQYVLAYESSHRKLDGSFRKVSVAIKEKPGRERRIALSRAGYIMLRK